jgi:hypothetical protein
MANNFPNLKPALNIDNVNGIYVDSRITFTRAGGRTFFDEEMVKAEENLLLQSQTFDNASWTKSDATITANTEVAPDGTTTADTITASATGPLRHGISQANAGLKATVSIYVKAGTHNFFQISSTASAGNFANFDLTSGSEAVGTFGGGVSASDIVDAGDGWFRCSAVFDVTNALLTTFFNLVTTASAVYNETWTAAGTETMFIWQAQVENRTFVTAPTVTTTQPITRYQRLLKTAAANEWPREFDPVTGECLGRSVWESRTNLLQRSEEFDNAYWEKTNLSASANQTIAPDGTLTADLITENTASGFHVVQRAFTTSAVIYSLTIFAKAGTRNWLQLRIYDGTNLHAAFFNLSTGAVGTVTASAVATITSIGNGWYRCSVTPPSAVLASASGYMQYAFGSADNTPNYTGNGTGNMFIWGAQLEAGAFASPYIKTEASQVTRLADSAVMTGVNFSSWFNPEQGTLFADGSAASASGTFISANDNTSGNLIDLRQLSGNRFLVNTNTVTVATLTTGTTATINTFNNYAGSYKVDDFKFSFNGSSVVTDTSGVLPVVNQLMIGRTGGAIPVYLNSYIRRLTYYNQALTAANLQAITR